MQNNTATSISTMPELTSIYNKQYHNKNNKKTDGYCISQTGFKTKRIKMKNIFENNQLSTAKTELLKSLIYWLVHAVATP